MSRARGLLVLALVSSAAACLVTESLDGLTGGGGDGGAADVTIGDAEPDTMRTDGPSNDAPSAADAAPDVKDAGTTPDASDGPSGDVVQPDVVTTGPVSCADAGVLLCEDFENGLDMNKWPVTNNENASEMIDGTQHHRGSYALHVNVPALTTPADAPVDVAGNIRHYVTTALPSPLFIRAFVMFSSAQPVGAEAFFVAQQSASPYAGLQLEINEQTGYYAVTDWAGTGLFSSSTLATAPATWNCIEWELDPPASGTTTTNSDLWIDGAEVSSLHLASTPMSDIEALGFGVGFYQVTSLPAYDAWIDDIYVDTMRVGCDK